MLATLGLAAVAAGYETDQYTHRLQPIADAQPTLDRIVNQALVHAAAGWRGGADRYAFTLAIFNELGGLYWVDRIERLAIRSPEIERLPQFRHDSIYNGLPFTARRVNWIFGVGRTIKLSGVLTGSDKLGHFFSQGKKYYFSRLAGWREDHILGRGTFNERWLFGQLTTSIYSNADLVANYEGYLFYRSLFEDGIVPGKSAIVRFSGDRAEIQRAFSWSDYVNDYWDEALNPSHMSPAMAKSIQKAILQICPDYERAPEAFRVRNAAALAGRYAGIGLKPAPENSVPVVCSLVNAANAGR
ncbi:MAG: hypothetical protein ABI689_10610 [Thermoanaerobaculia bacterium]